MHDIFISYVEEDAAIVLKIAAGLEAAGYSVWYYHRDSLPGIPYLTQILQALDTSHAVVLVVSERALGSPQVDKEVIRAHESGKHFIPLLAGLTHEDYQRRRPEWAMMTGAAVSVPVSPRRVPQIVPRLVESLRRMGVVPQSERPKGSPVAEPRRLAAAPHSDRLPNNLRRFLSKHPLPTAIAAGTLIALIIISILVIRALLPDNGPSVSAESSENGTREQAGATPTSQTAPTVGQTPTAGPTPTPVSTPTPVPRTKQAVLASDDFSTSDGGLFPTQSANPSEYSIGYVDGEYLIFNRQDEQNWTTAWAGTLERFGDLLISVDVRFVGQDAGAFVGVRCRFNSTDYDGYEFGFDRDGKFWLDRLDDGNRTVLANFAAAPVFNGAAQRNRIEFRCAGNLLTAWVNDVQVVSIEDSAYREGTVALSAAIYTTSPAGRADVRFDNLVIFQP